MTTEATLKRPDDLLTGIGTSIMTKAIVYSIIAHFVLTVATSIPLFIDWTHYGVKSPSAINAIRTEENRQKAEAERRQKAAEKAEAEAKAAAEAAAKKPAAPAASAPAAGTVPGAPSPRGADSSADAKTPPEVQPMAPKKTFEYGDDLSLD